MALRTVKSHQIPPWREKAPNDSLSYSTHLHSPSNPTLMEKNTKLHFIPLHPPTESIKSHFDEK